MEIIAYFFKTTGKQLLQNIRGQRFVLAVFLCVCVCMLPTITYYDDTGYGSKSVLEFFVRGGFTELAANSVAFSSLAILPNFIYSPWFPMLLAAICAFPAVSLFVDEYHSGAFYFTVSGSSVELYSAVKFAAAGLTGGLVLSFGFGIYALLILLRFPGASSYPPEMVQEYQIMFGSTGARDLAVLVLHITVVAILFASAVMMLSVFLRDRYFLFGLPMLAIFFIDRLSMYVGTRRVDIYDEKKGWWKIFSPSSYSNFYRDFQWSVGLPYACFFLLALLELIIMYLVFRRRIGRKVRGNA